jgi:hypothetical protein
LQGILASGRQLVGMLTAENNRLPTAPKAVLPSVSHGSHIKWLEKELSRTDGDLDKAPSRRVVPL